MSGETPQALQHPRPTRDPDEPAYGLWPGTVVSDEDPDKEGKLQVRVDQFYGKASAAEKIEDPDLPWARPGGFAAGADSGTPRTPEVGAGVWVGFWGGKRAFPVWFGGFYGAGEVPSEFTSAYTPGPKTWLTKTPHGHAIEMRWVESEEEIRIETKNGIKIRLQDADALEGPRILLETKDGEYKLLVDAKLKKIEAFTKDGRRLLIDDQNQLVRLAALAQTLEMLDTGAGAMNLTTADTMTLTAVKLVLALGTITATALALTATGLLALSGAGVSIVTTAAAVAIGSAAAATAVVLATFLTAKYDIHTHLYSPGPGGPTPTGPPVPLHGGAAADVSQKVVVD